MRLVITLICLLCFSVSGLFAQKTVFEKVKIRRYQSTKNRVLVDKIGTLAFDDSARKLSFEDHAGDNIEVGYDDVLEAIFEVTTHMRGGAASTAAEASVAALSLGGLVVSSAIARVHVNDYWLYLECKGPSHNRAVLIDLPKASSAQVIDKANSVFGSRVSVTDFPEKGAAIKTEDLKALRSKQAVKVDKQYHPLPELRPDKATVVVVCPALAARYAGSGIQFKLHANDQVIAVNRMGTYSLAYLDPGKYRLVSQAENANGFEMDLEGGHQYYFLQNTFQQTLTPNQTALSRNSRELVMYLLDGSYFSDWKPKEK
ncbi:MAG: hypothetical protein WA718_11520 [Terriglobales bacterium]